MVVVGWAEDEVFIFFKFAQIQWRMRKKRQKNDW